MDSLLELLKSAHPRPLFSAEGPQFYQQALAHNAPYAVSGPWRTNLDPRLEQLFRQWVRSSRVPFNPDESQSDYDMRGFFKAMLAGKQAPWLGGHFPDTYKTPYDTTFSGESMYAKPNAPFLWMGDQLVDMSTGQVIFGAK